MAHYGMGKNAQTKVRKDPNAAYTKAALYWQGTVTLADGSSHLMTIRKGKGVDIARAFGLPFAPIMTAKGLRKHLDALSAFKAETVDAAKKNVAAVKASSRRLAELEQQIGENAAEDGTENLVKEREEEIKRNCTLIEEHAKTWKAYLDMLYAYNAAAAVFGVPIQETFKMGEVA